MSQNITQLSLGRRMQTRKHKAHILLGRLMQLTSAQNPFFLIIHIQQEDRHRIHATNLKKLNSMQFSEAQESVC